MLVSIKRIRINTTAGNYQPPEPKPRAYVVVYLTLLLAFELCYPPISAQGLIGGLEPMTVQTAILLLENSIRNYRTLAMLNHAQA